MRWGQRTLQPGLNFPRSAESRFPKSDAKTRHVWFLMIQRITRVTRFLIQHRNRTLVCGFGICVRIANSSQSCPSQLAQGAHHVKHHACLAGLIEMQVVPDHDVEQIVRSQECDSAAIRRDRWPQRISAGH